MSFSFKNHKIAFVFASLSALVVIYHTQRMWMIHDFSYIIEYAYRIYLGDIAFKDFFLQTTPGTYYIQALLIKLFGLTLIPQIIYCSIVSFITYLVTYRLLFYINNDKWLNISLALPISLTGGYGISLQAFYDVDCMLFILFSLLIFFYAYQKGFPEIFTFIAGFISFIPTFFKQSTGPIFLISFHVIFLIAVFYKNDKMKLENYLWFLFGSFSGIMIFLLYIMFTCGLSNFIFSTLTVPFIYRHGGSFYFFKENFRIDILGYAVIWLLIIVVLRYFKIDKNRKNIICFILMILPLYLIPIIRQIFFHTSYFVTFIKIWPVTMILSVLALFYGFFKFRNGPIFYILLLVVFNGYIHAAFFSSGYTVSSYGIWPILSLVFALLYLILSKSDFFGFRNLVRNLFISNFIIITFSLVFYIKLILPWSYVTGLDPEGEIHHSITPNLKGFSMPGDFVTNLDNLVKITNDEIPYDDAIVILPHGDPFYFATGRKLLFPILMNDYAFNYYKMSEIVEKVKLSNVKWIILNKEYNMGEAKKIEDFMLIFKDNFDLYKNIPGYDIYKRNNSINER